LKDALQDLKKRKREMDEAQAKYDPMREQCEAERIEYKKTLSAFVRKCALTLYDQSCERACVELQAASSGCGLVEGSAPGSDLGQGGVEATCEPPSGSWFSAATTEAEAKGEMCKRIKTAQPVKHMQSVKISGWLMKSQILKYGRRYFVLESGDAAHPALLRYYKKATPSEGGQEQWKKAIKIQKGTVVEPSQTRKDNGCFKISNPKQEHELCVPSGSTDAEGIRASWVTALRAEISRR